MTWTASQHRELGRLRACLTEMIGKDPIESVYSPDDTDEDRRYVWTSWIDPHVTRGYQETVTQLTVLHAQVTANPFRSALTPNGDPF